MNHGFPAKRERQRKPEPERRTRAAGKPRARPERGRDRIVLFERRQVNGHCHELDATRRGNASLAKDEDRSRLLPAPLPLWLTSAHKGRGWQRRRRAPRECWPGRQRNWLISTRIHSTATGIP